MAPPAGPRGESTRSIARRRLDSAAFFRGEREVMIVHRGQEYRLRITKADKLVLTK